jgi:hypothetical protein
MRTAQATTPLLQCLPLWRAETLEGYTSRAASDLSPHSLGEGGAVAWAEGSSGTGIRIIFSHYPPMKISLREWGCGAATLVGAAPAAGTVMSGWAAAMLWEPCMESPWL